MERALNGARSRGKARARSSAFGAITKLSRIGWRLLRSPMMRTLKRNSGTLSGSIWIRLSELWCSVVTRRVSAKHWSAHMPLPLRKGYGRTQTHDYIRHGTITLFAALSYLEGKIISRTEESHTHVEWLRFLKQIDRGTLRTSISTSDPESRAQNTRSFSAGLKLTARFHISLLLACSLLMVKLVERFREANVRSWFAQRQLSISARSGACH